MAVKRSHVALLPVLQMQAASEHRLSWPCHIHMIICFPPLNLQGPTRQIHPANEQK